MRGYAPIGVDRARAEPSEAGASGLAEELYGFLFSNVIGSLAGLMWCYIIYLQIDPKLECPAPGCWHVVWALGVWSLVGVLLMPWLSVQAIRTLSVRGTNDGGGSPTSAKAQQWEAPPPAPSLASCVSLACRRAGAGCYDWCKTRNIEQLTIERARTLLVSSTGTAWSVGLYSALSACVQQLEFDTLATRFSTDESASRAGLFGACADAASLGCALRGILELALAAAALAFVVTASAIGAMGAASRLLARGNISPVFVEMLLMLRSNLYYSVAYTWVTTIGLIWFAPYELAPVADNALSTSGTWSTAVRSAFAGARALTLVLIFTRLALTSLGAVPRDDDVDSTASAPWSTCARLLIFKASAVTVAIATNDAAQGLLISVQSKADRADAFSFSLTFAGWLYCAALLAGGGAVLYLARRHRHRRRRQKLSSSSLEREQFARECDYATTSKPRCSLYSTALALASGGSAATQPKRPTHACDETLAWVKARGSAYDEDPPCCCPRFLWVACASRCDDADDEDGGDGRREKRVRFLRLVYTWLVIFATWSPWKRLLIATYTQLQDYVGLTFLLPFQLALAVSICALLAFLSALLHRAAQLLACAVDTAPRDAQQYAHDDDGDATAGNPFLEDPHEEAL